MRRRSTGGALEMFSLPLPLRYRYHFDDIWRNDSRRQENESNTLRERSGSEVIRKS